MLFSFGILRRTVDVLLVQPREFLCFLGMDSSVAPILSGDYDRPSISGRSFTSVSGFSVVSLQLYT